MLTDREIEDRAEWYSQMENTIECRALRELQAARRVVEAAKVLVHARRWSATHEPEKWDDMLTALAAFDQPDTTDRVTADASDNRQDSPGEE